MIMINDGQQIYPKQGEDDDDDDDDDGGDGDE